MALPSLKPKFLDLKISRLNTLVFELVTSVWNTNVNATSSASRITAKFKLLRAALKKWSKGLSNLNNLIKDCNNSLEVLDALEEQRALYTQEHNFRIILKAHILRLLRYKKDYWKKRYTVRWTKFGEGTRFFHGAATERYRLNTITSLDTADGRIVTDHNEQAALLLEEYKKRMSSSTDPAMLYNLDQLIHPRDDLDHLQDFFPPMILIKSSSKLPNDKASGPDGFNGLFSKVVGIL